MTLEMLMRGYAGEVTGEAFDRASEAAWELLLGQTRCRVLSVEDGTILELVQAAFDALVDSIAGMPQDFLQSETLGQWSRTYRSGAAQYESLRGILLRYLGETGLLYRGWPA